MDSKLTVTGELLFAKDIEHNHEQERQITSSKIPSQLNRIVGNFLNKAIS